MSTRHLLVTNPPLAPTLQPIVAAELARGNAVREISTNLNWPPGCELIVSFVRKFKLPAAVLPDVTFRLVNDPHYWYAEYNFKQAQQLLLCGFAD